MPLVLIRVGSVWLFRVLFGYAFNWCKVMSLWEMVMLSFMGGVVVRIVNNAIRHLS